MSDFRIRPERSGDYDAIERVLEASFENPGEARLVTALRDLPVDPWLGLVAENEAGDVVGHIAFSPVYVMPKGGQPGDEWSAIALAPLGVDPDWQRRGAGKQLTRAGLEACRELGHSVVFVLGDPAYYPQFGFRSTADFGITCEYDVPPEVFMVAELEPGAIAGRTGEVRYHPAFANLE